MVRLPPSSAVDATQPSERLHGRGRMRGYGGGGVGRAASVTGTDKFVHPVVFGRMYVN